MNWDAAGWVTFNCEASYTAAKVLGVIAAHTGDHSGGRTAWPSLDRIAELTKVDEKTVRRAIKSLAKSDGLEWVSNGGPANANGQRSNLYTLPECFGWQAVQDAIKADDPRVDIMSSEVVIRVVGDESYLNPLTTTSNRAPSSDIMSTLPETEPEMRQSRGRKPRVEPEPERQKVESTCTVCEKSFMTYPLHDGQIRAYCSRACGDVDLLGSTGIQRPPKAKLLAGSRG